MDLSLSSGASAAHSFPDLAGQLFALRSCALLSLASYTVALLGRVDSDVNATHALRRAGTPSALGRLEYTSSA